MTIEEEDRAEVMIQTYICLQKYITMIVVMFLKIMFARQSILPWQRLPMHAILTSKEMCPHRGIFPATNYYHHHLPYYLKAFFSLQPA